MAKHDLYTYEVSGAGNFPIDMLRYDCCFPADSTAISHIMDEPGFHSPRSEFFTTRRTVKLHGIKLPTTGRWASFGWAVERKIEKNGQRMK